MERRKSLVPLGKRPHGARATALGAIGLLVVIIPMVNFALSKFRGTFNVTTNTLVLLTITLTVAIKAPIWLTTVCALENFLFLNYLFTPPFHTLLISNRNDLVALLVFLAFSITASFIVRKLEIRTTKLRQLSKEGLFLSSLADSIIRGHNSIDEILENSKSTFRVTDLAVISGDGTSGHRHVVYGTITPASREKEHTRIPLNAEYSLIAFPEITDSQLLNLLTTFGSQILILLERQLLEASERELSDVRQADQMRVALLNAVSHDLRGPLASSKAAISSLLNSQVSWTETERAELLNSANRSLDQLNHLIENLLDMSRLEAGTIFLNWRNVGVEDAVAGATKSLKSQGTGIVIQIDPELPPIKADPILLERVIGNLLENAVRYSPSDRPATITAEKTREQIEIKIIDHGPGLSQKDTTKLFVPFQRFGDRDSTTGVGLGLAIVKGFTELMGGHVAIEATAGGGLTAVLTFRCGGEA